MTFIQTQPCIVVTDRGGEFDWLGQFNDIATARSAMAEWLKADDRDSEDAAFILPILDFGRPAMEA